MNYKILRGCQVSTNVIEIQVACRCLRRHRKIGGKNLNADQELALAA